jgi:hypothetical protein
LAAIIIITKTFLQYLPDMLLHHLVHPLPVPPQERLSPLLAKCSIISNIGSSGSTQTQDALCLLTVNLINQKVFLVIWLGMALLLVTSFLLLGNTFLTAIFPLFRRRALQKLSGEELTTQSHRGQPGGQADLRVLAGGHEDGVSLHS